MTCFFKLSADQLLVFFNDRGLRSKISPCQRNCTLGARDFSSAVSGFCQFFIVTCARVNLVCGGLRHRIQVQHTGFFQQSTGNVSGLTYSLSGAATKVSLSLSKTITVIEFDL